MTVKRILVPVDFSEPSKQALEYALQLGAGFRPEVIVLFVVEPLRYGAAELKAVMLEQRRAAREQLDLIEADLKRRKVRVQTRLQMGAPADTIVKTARRLKADLIALGTHGRTGISHLLMGSVAEQVVRLAHCPVLTVHASAPRSRRPRRQRMRKAAGRH